MFQDFRKAVLDFYEIKKNSGQLSENLIEPTLAKLKKECLIILKNRYQSKDDETITAFFDSDKKFADQEQRIEKFDPEGFKALHKFLIGKSGIRKEETVKLLAWIIDFEPRPYVWGWENGKSEMPKDPEQEAPQPLPIPSPPSKKLKWTPNKLRKAVLAFTILIVAIGTGTYFSLKTKSTRAIIFNPTLTGNEQCMYWTGDQYRPISCNQKVEGVIVVALDPGKVSHLKKITRPDTLTKFSVGKVWWGKINGKVDFYTAGGEHPEDNRKRLLPMSAYMLNKYVIKE